MPKRKAINQDTLDAVLAEMQHRAENGCTGNCDTYCSDPENDPTIHPSEWCNKCLMGAVVMAHGQVQEQKREEIAALARAMRKTLPLELLNQVLAFIDPLTPFLAELRRTE